MENCGCEVRSCSHGGLCRGRVGEEDALVSLAILASGDFLEVSVWSLVSKLLNLRLMFSLLNGIFLRMGLVRRSLCSQMEAEWQSLQMESSMGGMCKMCWRAYTGVDRKPLQMRRSEPLRAVWRRLVFELENLLPHHSWHPYIRMGMTVVSVRVLSWRWDMPFTKFPRMRIARIVLVALAASILVWWVK